MDKPSKYSVIINGIVVVVLILTGVFWVELASWNRACEYDGGLVPCDEQ